MEVFISGPDAATISRNQEQEHQSASLPVSASSRIFSIIDPKYHHIFNYPTFNKLQVELFDDVYYGDRSIVVSAPTGSGKTMVLEFAIIKIMNQMENDFKIIYMAPLKALCSERFHDWQKKFSPLGITCVQATGDSDLEFSMLQNFNLIITTPEKWDSLTRRWKDHKTIVNSVKLMIIDEVHLLNEKIRGPVLEAVVSRMKTIEASTQIGSKFNVTRSNLIRFIAISATIPNAVDIAEWLGFEDNPAVCYKLGEEYRPVKLKKIVEGYQCREGDNMFRFDMSLTFKLKHIIERYCDGKPTLIFCNTRKSVEYTANQLSKELIFQFNDDQNEQFMSIARNLRDKKLQDLAMNGIGCHHAGYYPEDKFIIEEMFRSGILPILVTTSTLATGVNLPAHLVIIKTTQQYINGLYQEYEETTILQMMGRAGRPQFDDFGIAVIMTKMKDKDRYVKLCSGNSPVESNLHRHLAEHLNTEIALGAIQDLGVAADWIKSTFLYVRAIKNPKHYGFPYGATKQIVEKKLQGLCLININGLVRSQLVKMTEETEIISTDGGMLMAKYSLQFTTMKLIMNLKGTESLSDLISVLSQCGEFADVRLRVNEKRYLNAINKKKNDMRIRFLIPGKINTSEMKVNCLIQSQLDGITINESSLYQEAIKITRMSEHLSKCILKYVLRTKSFNENIQIYKLILNAVILHKCFTSRMWENSLHVAKQFHGIGPKTSELLVGAGIVSFQSIIESNPRDLERILNKRPPAGNDLIRLATLLPKYRLSANITPTRTLSVTIELVNYEELSSGAMTAGENHQASLIVGDSENNLLLFETFYDARLLNNGKIVRFSNILVSDEHKIYTHYISHTWVGLDQSQVLKVKRSQKGLLSEDMQKNIRKIIEKSKDGAKENIKTNKKHEDKESVDFNFNDIEESQQIDNIIIAIEDLKNDIETDNNKIDDFDVQSVITVSSHCNSICDKHIQNEDDHKLKMETNNESEKLHDTIDDFHDIKENDTSEQLNISLDRISDAFIENDNKLETTNKEDEKLYPNTDVIDDFHDTKENVTSVEMNDISLDQIHAHNENPEADDMYEYVCINNPTLPYKKRIVKKHVNKIVKIIEEKRYPPGHGRISSTQPQQQSVICKMPEAQHGLNDENSRIEKLANASVNLRMNNNIIGSFKEVMVPEKDTKIVLSPIKHKDPIMNFIPHSPTFTILDNHSSGILQKFTPKTNSNGTGRTKTIAKYTPAKAFLEIPTDEAFVKNNNGFEDAIEENPFNKGYFRKKLFHDISTEASAAIEKIEELPQLSIIDKTKNWISQSNFHFKHDDDDDHCDCNTNMPIEPPTVNSSHQRKVTSGIINKEVSGILKKYAPNHPMPLLSDTENKEPGFCNIDRNVFDEPKTRQKKSIMDIFHCGDNILQEISSRTNYDSRYPESIIFQDMSNISYNISRSSKANVNKTPISTLKQYRNTPKPKISHT